MSELHVKCTPRSPILASQVRASIAETGMPTPRHILLLPWPVLVVRKWPHHVEDRSSRVEDYNSVLGVRLGCTPFQAEFSRSRHHLRLKHLDQTVCKHRSSKANQLRKQTTTGGEEYLAEYIREGKRRSARLHRPKSKDFILSYRIVESDAGYGTP